MSNDFSQRLKKLRVFLELSQKEFSEMVDIPTPSYRKYEIGEREPLFTAVQKIVMHPRCKDYGHWLITGETQPLAGNVAPVENSTKSMVATDTANFEKSFIDEVTKTLQMFGYLDWITVNTDKIDFDACGKLLLKEVAPIIDSHYSTNSKNKAV